MPEVVGMWERVKDIGSGGFGVVVLWKKIGTEQHIAIKQCRWGEPGTGTEALMLPKVRERWQKEVEIMLKLNHRGIVSCMPVPSDFRMDPAALPRLCMEYCEGGDLRRVLLRPENCCGLPELEVRQFLSDITDALGYLHGLRIIHRDLKPENVVLQKTDGRVLYKLIDLGYAKELDQSSVCTSFVGTLQYLAPELFLTNKYTSTADYWSLGLVAHEVVTGVRPFLPNMLPAKWMQHVSEKGADDICAEEKEDGSIQFRSEIIFCNQISVPLRRHLERWLRRLLDWDPRRRGRALVPVGVGDQQPQQQQLQQPAVVVFGQLQQLLQRRVVPVFCENSCQLLHVEITEATSMAQLQECIALETGLEPFCQRLYLPGCGGRPAGPVDTNTPAQSALQCWAPPEEVDWMLYVFDSSRSPCSDGAPSTINLPPLVRSMLKHTDHRPEYYRQRAVFAQSVFFIQQHVRLLNLREKAQHVHMVCLAASMARLSKLAERLLADLCRLQAASELFLASLACDDDNYIRQAADGGVTSDDAYRRWRRAGEHVRGRFLQHKQRVHQLTSQVNDISREGTELQRVPAAGLRPDDFRASYDKACVAYDNHRRRPKDQRSRCTGNDEMIRIVVKFLRNRDEPFKHCHDVICRQQLVELRTHQLFQPVCDALNGVGRGLEVVTKCQKQRQGEIWSLMRIVLGSRLASSLPAAVADGALTPAVGSGSGSVDVRLTDGPDENSNSESAEQPAAGGGQSEAVMTLSSLLDSATLETSDAVSENLNLHAEISELLRTKQTAPPPDGGPIDWSFLN